MAAGDYSMEALGVRNWAALKIAQPTFAHTVTECSRGTVCFQGLLDPPSLGNSKQQSVLFLVDRFRIYLQLSMIWHRILHSLSMGKSRT